MASPTKCTTASQRRSRSTADPHEIRIDRPTVARFTGQLITFHDPTNIAGILNQDDDGVITSRFTSVDAIIMVFEFDQVVPYDAFFEGIISQFEGHDVNLVTGRAELRTHPGTLDGRYLHVEIAGAIIRQEVYRIATENACSFLILQDGRDEPEVPTPEYTRLVETLTNSFNTR